MQLYNEFRDKANFVEVTLVGDGDCFFRAVAIALVVRGVIPRPNNTVDASRYINAVRASLLWSAYMSGPFVAAPLVRVIQYHNIC